MDIVTANDHGFAVGDAVIVALTNTFDGTFTVLEDGFLIIKLEYNLNLLKLLEVIMVEQSSSWWIFLRTNN